MKHRKSVEWRRLDNASKFFPSISNEKDTKVFRITCELYEPIDPEILQQSLNLTIESFPLYKSVLRRGIFWYYLEASNIEPVVEIESIPVCAPIYIRDRRNLLFRVSYFNNRINLEIFHALSDGTGGLYFMKTLLYHYLSGKHREKFADKLPLLDYNASISQQLDDSFGRYYKGLDTIKLITGNTKGKENVRAYHIRGTRPLENRIKVIEGCMSADEVLQEAHKYGVTLTVFFTALFMYSIYKDMPVYKRNRPIVLSVPINLRQFYDSGTARNFFSTMNIGYDFNGKDVELEDVIQSVSESFKKELKSEEFNNRINRYIALEKNLLTKTIPLPLKDLILRIANSVSGRGVTAAISNMGRISMHPEFDEYTRQFSITTSARRPQITMCTYGDMLSVSFATPYREAEIQRIFFNMLSQKGIKIEISSNL